MKTISSSESMNLTSSTDLYQRITAIKAELHELVKTLGIVHELTVAKSQELDLVVNEYMCSKHQF